MVARIEYTLLMANVKFLICSQATPSKVLTISISITNIICVSYIVSKLNMTLL